ncbi:hypothetical protein [Kutzneria sp. CA-103260]|uniref:hypothetical protein n=1 Tax=Kutzneria sp. CA-103260 TaxID=2802641 RepID=UPI001BA6D8C3|nr:hypothetical protein [Kutzneria sp. CA-103260]
MVPREHRKNPEFLALNRKISAVWGFAVLVLGVAHLATDSLGSLPSNEKLLFQWGPTIIVMLFAVRYTRQVVNQARNVAAARQSCG